MAIAASSIREIAQINKLGVRVRYTAYPRAGPGTDDWQKMEAVWCSKDRKSCDHAGEAGRRCEGRELRRDAGRETI